MDTIFKKIGLSDNLRIELPISISDFVNTLSSNVDSPQWDFFDVFSSSRNRYKGSVKLNSFELKQKRRLFDTNVNWARVSGSFRQEGEKVIVDIGINGFRLMMIPFFILGIVIYGITVVAIIGEGDAGAGILPFLLIHALFMFGIPYFIMKRSVRSAKYDIERDIYFLMKDKLNVQQQFIR